MIRQVMGSMKLRQVYESLVSLSFNLTGLIAGALLASSHGLFSEFSWAIVLYPGILSMRGALGGLFSGRISTALHLGTIRPTLKDNTKSAYNLLNSIIVLTLVSSLVMSVLGSVTCLLSGYIGLGSVPRIFVTMVTTMGLSIILISPFTYRFSVFSFNRGLDPDKLVYPVVSTFSDIVITGCYVIVLWSVIRFPVFSLVAHLAVSAVFCYYAYTKYVESLHDEEFMETIREFLMTLAVVSLIMAVTGRVMGSISNKIGDHPGVYLVYPAIIDTVGDLGSIVGSTATTKMALGYIKAELSGIKDHLTEIVSAWIASLILFIMYGLIAYASFGGDLVVILARTVSMNLVMMPIISVITFAVAIETRNHGLDPDNFIIPIETSLSDGLTTLVLFLALTLIG
ncbi:MAG: magnesium transporter [Candidatus Bathyarchaeota archaeon]